MGNVIDNLSGERMGLESTQGDSASIDTSADDKTSTYDISSHDNITQETQSNETEEKITPFASGKEKFKVNGSEEEWTWEETRKWAQLGKAGYKSMERAATLEKKVAENYRMLQQLALSNPEALIEVLAGKKPNSSPSNGQMNNPQSNFDPKEEKISSLESRLEAFEIAEERKLIESEMSDAIKKYPLVNDPIYIDYIKAQYAKALRNDMPVTLEDVTFHVYQMLKDKQNKELMNQKQRIQENKKKAPLVSRTASFDPNSEKEMTIEDVKRLAGRA